MGGPSDLATWTTVCLLPWDVWRIPSAPSPTNSRSSWCPASNRPLSESCNQTPPAGSAGTTFGFELEVSSGQVRSGQSCLTLCDPMDCSTLGFPVHHQLPELAPTHVHRVSDTIQPSHPLLSPSPLTFNLSQHQGLFQWVSSSNQMAKVLEFPL